MTFSNTSKTLRKEKGLSQVQLNGTLTYSCNPERLVSVGICQ